MNGTVCAAKMLARTGITAENMERFKEEIALMSRLKHQNIVEFMACAWQPPDVIMCIELCSRGSLDTMLRDPACAMTWESPCLSIAADVARGLSYLHTKCVRVAPSRTL
jgi:serine/threonine protein kinase